ncbi:MAG TPA: SRPBCC family protein [Longimicrobiaceae bacterium]|nr:SRPBCC family protein [Longimicrobiaceae bacterium]
MRNFSVSVAIQAPAARVWEVMTAVERWPEWTASVTSVRRITAGPFAMGSRVVIKQPGFPHALWKVVEMRPGERFAWRSIGPGFSVLGHHAVAPGEGGCTATLSLEFRGPLGGWFGRLTRKVNERYLGMEAAGLKRRSEHPADAAAATGEARADAGAAMEAATGR